MRKLSVNIDHIATLRQARKTLYPEVIIAAGICELAGADGITFHLREDRRHIQDRDVRLLKETVTTKLNFEMASTKEMIKIANDIKPYMVTLVPEKREELTTEGGLNIISQINELRKSIDTIKANDIFACLFVDADLKQIDACKEVGCDYIEIHTGNYCDEKNIYKQSEELNRIIKACKHAHDLGISVNAGHGIYYNNITPLAQIKEIEEFSIGHGIISRAVFVGLEKAVKEMKQLIQL
ncbi:MAG: pyridoxine 5'-phosphate synthase [Spirochaetota bacterium]|nr:pyridoxine 5'-phosphate synthase [Spirochaetota bacterium]